MNYWIICFDFHMIYRNYNQCEQCYHQNLRMNMKTFTTKICNIYDNSSILKLCKMFYLKSLMSPKTFCSFSLDFFISHKICIFYNLVKKMLY